MWTLGLVIVGVIVVALALTWALRRRDWRYANPVVVAMHVVLRVAGAVFAGWAAAQLARRGGALHVVLAGLVALISVYAISTAALFVWAIFRSSSEPGD